MIICFPFTNMWFINCISYRLTCVYMIFYYIIQSEWSFLHISAANGHTDVCSFLILKGANINQVDRVSIHCSCVTTDNIYIWYIPSGKDLLYHVRQKNSAEEIWSLFVKAQLFHESYSRSYISYRRYISNL